MSASAIENENLLRQEIVRQFQAHYPTLKIEKIALQPNRNDTFAYTPACRVITTRSTFRKNRGTLLVKCKGRSHFIKYRLDGTLGVYKAIHQIKKDKIISSKEIEYTVVPFEKMRDKPVTDILPNRWIARRTIRKGKIITESMLAALPPVRKGERVRCLYREGSVLIEFDATALKNGYIGDTVTLKNSKGRTLRGVVKERKLVEIR